MRTWHPARRTSPDGTRLDQARGTLDQAEGREQQAKSGPVVLSGQVDANNVPKDRIDALVSKGYAQNFIRNGQEVSVVTLFINGKWKKLVFARNWDGAMGSEGTPSYSPGDTYSLVGAGPATMDSKTLAELKVFDRQSPIRMGGVLEFSLHVLPGGTLADKLVNGEGSWGDVGLASAGDAAFFIGVWAKTATGARALWLAGTATALEAGTGLYAGGQAGYYLTQGDLTGATRSGIEAMLILWGVKGDYEDIVNRLRKPKVADDLASSGANTAQKKALANDPPIGLPPLRQAYISEVEALKDTASQMQAAGKTPEEIARTLHQMRRDIGIKYKDLTPPGLLEQIYQRNLQKYGDKFGPTIDYLRGQGKTWEEIIESASRPGGADLGLGK